MIEGDSKRVTFEVHKPESLEGGVTLKPGLYMGKCTKTWLGFEYKMEMTAEELKSLGAPAPTGVDDLEFDVTRLVRLEKLTVF